MRNTIQKLFEQADRYLAQKQLKTAIDLLTLIIDSGKTVQQDRANAYVKRGVLYNKHKQYRKAIADYREAIMLANNSGARASAYIGTGTAYYYLGEYDEAKAAYSKAIELSRDAAIRKKARQGIDIVNKALISSE